MTHPHMAGHGANPSPRGGAPTNGSSYFPLLNMLQHVANPVMEGVSGHFLELRHSSILVIP
jgi:hypothetical protein